MPVQRKKNTLIRRPRSFPLVFVLSAALAWMGTACAHPVVSSQDIKPTLILVSLDGFRADYLQTTPTPNLTRLISEGVRAEGLIPPFPSQTFPSHTSMVTGLSPEKHGIVANRFYDPSLERDFVHKDPKIAGESVWWQAEPIWVTAEKQGMKTAPLFWVGSTAEVNGVRPSYWKPYSDSVPHSERVRQLLEWIDLPVSQRPEFLTLYLESIDTAGHKFGPDSAEVKNAVIAADRTLGELIQGLESRNALSKVDLVVLSDHGMVSTSPERTLFLEDFISLPDVRVLQTGAIASLIPLPGKEAKIYKALTHAHPRFQVFKRKNAPRRLHYRDNPRIATISVLGDPGWTVVSTRKEAPKNNSGAHGWEPTTPELYGIFIAHGPSFKRKTQVAAFSNLLIYSLSMEALGLQMRQPISSGDQMILNSILDRN